MTPLREKMKQEMILIGLAESTQFIYLKAVVRLHDYYNKSPAKLTTTQIREYLLHLLQRKKLAPSTYNTQVYALRFFYCITLRQPLRKIDLPTTKVKERLPSILSVHEVERILQATSNIKHRALLMVIYSAGLRVSEAVNLRIKDIDSDRMTLHIRDSKGGKDRFVILSPKVHNVLRQYWKACHFADYIFPNNKDNHKPLSKVRVLQIFKDAKKLAGVTKEGSIHSLRQAFATHMLEKGVDLFTIKTLLGHASIQTTVRYLAFIPNKAKPLPSPIESFKL